MSEDGRPVVFGGKEISPEEEAGYRAKIRNAQQGKLDAVKGSAPVGVVPRPSIPFRAGPGEEDAIASAITADGGVQPRPKGSPVISDKTRDMLQQAATQLPAEETTPAKAEEKHTEEELLEMFDFGGRNEADRILNNKKRRQEIEARLEPMELGDLISRDEVQQLVPIVPGKFEVLFRSMTPEESLFIKRYVAKTDQGQSDQYMLERFSLCQLACSVLAINGRPFPDHRNVEGVLDEKAFEVKLKMLMKKSAYVLADLGINYYWFDIRVRKLMTGGALGNG